jgi:hypothetical protein
MPPVKDQATGKFVSADPNLEAELGKEQEATPAKATVKEPKLDTEAITDFASDFITGDKPERKKAPEKAKEEKPAAEEKPKVPATKPAPKPAAKPELTAESIAKAVGEGVAQAMKATPKDDGKPKEKEPADPDANLSEPVKKKVVVLRQMEKLQPEKYKGVADKYKANLIKIEEYKDKWEKENPGQEYDEEAEEHTEFYEKNQLSQPWDDEDYSDAKAEIIAARRVAESSAETNKKLSQLEREKKGLEARPVIDRVQTVAARNYWGQIGGDFDGLIQENGQLDQAKFKALQEKNPDFLNVTLESAKRLDALVEAAFLLKKGLVDYSQDNPAHAFLSKFAVSKEQELLAEPPDKQRDQNGRPFKPANEYYKLPQGEREAFWTFGEGDLAALLARSESKKMKQFIAAEEEKFNRWAKSKGLSAKESMIEEKTENKGKQEEFKAAEEAPVEKESEPESFRSPSSSASPKSATAADAAKKGNQSGVDAFMSDFLS